MDALNPTGTPEGGLRDRFRRRSLRHQVRELRARVEELEEAMHEARRHQLRVAELTDVVQELLVPIARRDQDAVDELLATYTDQLG
ncbi:DUF6752 domain-containing protein [Nocardioides pantholopis]|uniref:DUF6752 domain-containing protein n=1 Tax=Nocardioides pantholopis TaxID=2483798 RepID=UPI001F14E9A0|nr:DUF6752 domain-containing protein [Nocardioides pantholopis]